VTFQRRQPAAIGVKAPYPGFIEPALATSMDKVPSGERWIHEIKFDGYRVQVHLVNELAKVFTRRGYDGTKRFRKVADDAWHIGAGSAITRFGITTGLPSRNARPQADPSSCLTRRKLLRNLAGDRAAPKSLIAPMSRWTFSYSAPSKAIASSSMVQMACSDVSHRTSRSVIRTSNPWLRPPFACSGCDRRFRTAILYSDFPLLMWPPKRGAFLSCDTSLGANGALLG
jgi:hypothetical protein